MLRSSFVMWLGVGMGSNVELRVRLTLFVVFFNAFQGGREVDPNLTHNARILGAGPRQLSFDVMLPAALGWITSSLHTSFGFEIGRASCRERVTTSAGAELCKTEGRLTDCASGARCAVLPTATRAMSLAACA